MEKNIQRNSIRLLEIFKKADNKLALAYESVIAVLNAEHISDHIRMAALGVREILNKLPGYFDVPFKKNTDDLGKLIGKFKEVWEEKKISSYLEISWQDFHEEPIKNFLMECRDFFQRNDEIRISRKEPVIAAARVLHIRHSEENIPEYLEENIAYQWKKFLKYFNGMVHSDYNETDKETFIYELSNLQNFLVELIEPNIFDSIQEIDEVIKSGENSPNKEHVKRAIKKCTTKVAFDYFLKNLKSPVWIEPLDAERVFDYPLTFIEINGILQIPFWEPSKYLARVASFEPEKVLSIINKIPSTNNSRIHEDFVNAALSMPPRYAKKLITKTIESLNNPYKWLLPEKVTELAIYFLKSNLIEESIEICRTLFHIKYSGEKHKPYEHLFISDWTFNKQIKLFYSHIESCEIKIKFAELLCNKLYQCMKYETQDENERKFKDGSYIWRGIIANKKNDFHNDPRNILVNWIVESYDYVFTQEPEQKNGIFNYLFMQQFCIFNRIGLYFASKYPADSDILASILVREGLAKSNDAWYEYVAALKNVYPNLPKNKKKLILKFISAITFYSSDEEEFELKNRKMQYKFLYLIKDHLNDSEKINFDSMFQEYGDIGDVDYLPCSSLIIINSISPLSSSEANEKPVEEIINFLKTWKFPSDKIWLTSNNNRFFECVGELTNVLESSVANRYEEYLEALSKSKINNCIYLLSIIRGFEKAINETNIFDWGKLCNFLRWATKNGNLESTKINDMEVDPSAIRKLTCLLLEKAFSLKTNQFPIKYKKIVWSIIQNCLNDSNPNCKNEEQTKIQDYNYYPLIRNYAHTLALECAIQYGLWITRKLNINKNEVNKKCYPELFAELEKHLNCNFEASKSVWSIYGRWLPWLYFLDKKWVFKYIKMIFPKGKKRLGYRKTSWIAYLFHSELFEEIFALIRNEYLDTVKLFSCNNSEDPNEIDKKFLQHIVGFYLQGKIDLSDEIIQILFNKNNIGIIKYIVSFTGRITPQTSKDRAMQLWVFILNKCNGLNEYSALSEFGFWCGLNFIDDNWVLEQIITVLLKCKTIVHVPIIMDRLILTANIYPEKVSQILRLIIENRVCEGGIYMWKSGLKILLPILLKSDASIEAREIIQKLGLLGFTEFGQLL